MTIVVILGYLRGLLLAHLSPCQPLKILNQPVSIPDVRFEIN